MRLTRFDRFMPSRAQRQAFTCGVPSLDNWLATQARQSMTRRDAVTYLLVDEEFIAGYFCLSAGEVRQADAPPPLARHAPGSVPIIRMGRFAIASAYQGQGWGAQLLREALLRAHRGGQLIGARAIVVDAMSEHAAGFYERFGFTPSPTDPRQFLYDLRVVGKSAGIE